MRFVLFTDKSVTECTKAIHERLQAPASSTRPNLGGYVEKGGRFSISLTSNVIGRFTRQTRLDGVIEKDNGSTVIRGTVPDGASPQGQIMVLGGLALVGLMILSQGQTALAVLATLAGFVVYIPLRGDYENSDKLLLEVERTLKASPKPPKNGTTATAAKKTTGTTRTVAAPKKTTTPSPAGAARTGSRPGVVKSGATEPKKTSLKPPAPAKAKTP
ncbi:MAG: hypothetical protein MUF87_10810 [Anaerolineae bacterium]|nr:hypothetical protein [Anaerolineae bacterium]